jgi:release factor glutamine methyltransferase
VKIADNTIQAVTTYFKQQLETVLDANELKMTYRIMMAHYFGFSATDLAIKRDHRFTESELVKVIHCVKRLQKQEPLAQIVGETEFFGLRFLVNRHTLIPRPETEELVDWVIKENANSDTTILEIGTGSGCIPISLKKHLTAAQVTSYDISLEALEVARKNALLNTVVVDFQQVDILSAAIDEAAQWDIIVSNPPYIAQKEFDSMDKNVTDYEPHLALFVGDDNPLVFYRKIAEIGLRHLAKEGIIYVEINQYLSEQTVELFQSAGYQQVDLRKDINGNYRMIKASKPLTGG